MMQFSLNGYSVEIDRSATSDWYKRYDGWGCECDHCRNFLKLARAKKLPILVMQILDELEIPPEKATYVGELYTDEQGIHYQFSYRLAGTILGVCDKEEFTAGDEGRCCHEPYPYGAPGFPEPHFDLEFYAVLPWGAEEQQVYHE